MKPLTEQSSGSSTRWKEILAFSVPICVILVAPLGVAGQNIGLGLGLLFFLIFSYLDRGKALNFSLTRPYIFQYLILWGLIVLPITIATFARGDGKDAIRFFWGYFLTCLMPIFGVSFRSIDLNRKLLLSFVSIVVGIMGLLALSQLLIGWKFESGRFVTQIFRAQGFYSHPLTLAYVALTFMPWCVARPMAVPRQWQSWFLALGIGSIVIASLSVTVIVITVLITFILAVLLLKRKHLVIFCLFLSSVSVCLLLTDNPLNKKFKAVLSGQRGDHETEYLDDRFAFWHANWEMFKAAPVLGHGTGLEAADRKPFYDKIGLSNIKRMYESHNMYLQYAVEGGFVAPLSFVVFLVWWFTRIRHTLNSGRWFRISSLMIPVSFALGGITQNAIQDSEVRFMLLFVCAISLWQSRDNAQQQGLNEFSSLNG